MITAAKGSNVLSPIPVLFCARTASYTTLVFMSVLQFGHLEICGSCSYLMRFAGGHFAHSNERRTARLEAVPISISG